MSASRQFAIVTGASTGIGLELARCSEVAKGGFHAMMRGDGDVVTGLKNKVQSSVAKMLPAGVLARQHRHRAEPGSTKS